MRTALIPLLLGPLLALAQPLPQLHEAALRNDPEVASAHAQLRAAEQGVVQARAAFGPTAVLTGTYAETRYREEAAVLSRPSDGGQASLQITQPLLRSASFPALDAAHEQLRQARAALEQKEAESAQRLVEACFELLKARDALVFAQVQGAATAEQLALAQRSYKVGTAAVTDVHDAEAKADMVAAQILAAEAELELRQQVLFELTGTPITGLLTRGLNSTQLPFMSAATLQQWLVDVEEGSARLKQAKAARAVAEAEVRRARHAHAPTADLNYHYTRGRDPSSPTSLYPRRGDSSAIGVTVSIPIFSSGATQAKVREARAMLDKAVGDEATARRTVTLEVRQASSGTLGAIRQARALTVAVHSQELALRSYRRGYEVGMKINAEVLDAQSRLFEARRDLSRARYDAWMNHLRLKVLAGRLSQADIAEIDSLLVPLPPQVLHVPHRNAGQDESTKRKPVR